MTVITTITIIIATLDCIIDFHVGFGLVVVVFKVIFIDFYSKKANKRVFS